MKNTTNTRRIKVLPMIPLTIQVGIRIYTLCKRYVNNYLKLTTLHFVGHVNAVIFTITTSMRQ